MNYNLYSYKGSEPSILPNRIRFDSGETRTSLDTLSEEELQSYGFIGPIIKPEINEFTQKLEWNGNEYVIIDLSEEEITSIKEQNRLNLIQQKIDCFDHSLFSESLLKTKFYQRLSTESEKTIESNTLYHNFMFAIKEAKYVKNFVNLQYQINVLFLNISFSVEEKESIDDLFEICDIDLVLSVPNDEYFKKYYYDSVKKEIVHKKGPFPSWVYKDGKWNPPISYPTDGKIYNWDESTKKWKEI